ncbi:MAG: response regulator [Armatimonadota bacterium]
MSDETIRILIVDDHAVLRAGLRHLLDAEDDMVVVGEAADGNEAVERAEALEPHVILMDIAMAGMGGLACTRRLKELLPEVAVLVLTMHDNREYLHGALVAGASGYVLKKAADTELIAAIRAAHRGDVFLDPSLARGLIQQVVPQAEEHPQQPRQLTPRETEVLALIARGHTNRRIAEMLSISVKTVEAHRANVVSKLGVKGRAPLVRYALQMGLLGPDK